MLGRCARATVAENLASSPSNVSHHFVRCKFDTLDIRILYHVYFCYMDLVSELNLMMMIITLH